MEKPPRRPRLAWDVDEGPEESIPSVESSEETPVVPLRADASWLPVYTLEQDNVEHIEAFVNSPSMSEHAKVGFLESVCSLLRTARFFGLQEGLDVFCHENKLTETIQTLLQEEPKDQRCTDVWRLGMDAIAELSAVQSGLVDQGRNLLETCCMRVFFLPMRVRCLSGLCYTRALASMDNMFERLVLNSPDPSSGEELQSILQLLLRFSRSDSPMVRERALGRIEALTQLLQSPRTWNKLHISWRSPFHSIPPQNLPGPLLGQLLGHVLLFRFAEDRTMNRALDVLHGLHLYLQRQKERPEPEHDVDELILNNETSPQDLTMSFAGSLYPRERAHMACVVIEAMKDSSIFDRGVAEDILELIMSDLDLWLAEIPSILRSIHECLRDSSRKETWHRMERLLSLMATKHPRALMASMVLNVPLRDRADVDMWEMVLTLPKTTEALGELLGMLQDTEDTSTLTLVPMASGAEGAEDPQSLLTVSKLLETLLELSKKPVLARKLQQLLPHIMGRLRDAEEELRIKALRILTNMMGHLPRKEASHIAVRLVQDLQPLLDEGCSELRELSIRLLQLLLESVVCCDRRRMRSKTWYLLLPLFFHMSDQSSSVAEASWEALLAAAMLLEWEELRRLLETRETWSIAECLLERSRKRAQGYLQQSLRYLQDAQVPLREAAIRFIGLAARPLRGKSPRKLEEICRALEALQDEDDLGLRSLAAQTVLILRSPPVQRGLGSRLRALFCCWERSSFP